MAVGARALTHTAFSFRALYQWHSTTGDEPVWPAPGRPIPQRPCRNSFCIRFTGQHSGGWSVRRTSAPVSAASYHGADAARTFLAPTGLDRGPTRADSDRTSVVKGKSVSVRVDLGGRRIRQKKKK